MVEASFLGQIVSQRGDTRWQDRVTREQSQVRKVSINTVQGGSGKQDRSGATAVKCGFCSQSHPLWKCSGFFKQSAKERWAFAKMEKLFFDCLDSHFAKTSNPRVCAGNVEEITTPYYTVKLRK